MKVFAGIVAVVVALAIALSGRDESKPPEKKKPAPAVSTPETKPIDGAAKTLAGSPRYAKLISLLRAARQNPDTARFETDLQELLRDPAVAEAVASYFPQETDPQLLFRMAKLLSAHGENDAVRELMLVQLREGDLLHQETAAFAFMGAKNAEAVEALQAHFEKGASEALQVNCAAALDSAFENVSDAKRGELKSLARARLSDGSPEIKKWSLEILSAGGLSAGDAAVVRNFMTASTNATEKMAYLKTLVDYKRLSNPGLFADAPHSDEDFKLLDKLVAEHAGK